MERTTEDIERLLERWYDAATTDDEERELREWFRESGTLPAGLESARRMFAGFELWEPKRREARFCTRRRTVRKNRRGRTLRLVRKSRSDCAGRRSGSRRQRSSQES